MVLVVTTHLQQLSAADVVPARRGLPDGCRFERVADITPEFSRFLYRSVGSAWNWADRLPLSREQWDALVSAEGVETWVLYGGGAPLGYAELAGRRVGAGTEVEIVYFGLFPGHHGRGLGGAMLTETLRRAWDLDVRWARFGPVSRVWVHTCSLDGPAALANYAARGMAEFHREHDDLEPQDASAGLWPEHPADAAAARRPSGGAGGPARPAGQRGRV